MAPPLIGRRVVIGGLSSGLNGRQGVAVRFEGGRYVVAIDGFGGSLRLRPENVSAPPPRPPPTPPPSALKPLPAAAPQTVHQELSSAHFKAAKKRLSVAAKALSDGALGAVKCEYESILDMLENQLPRRGKSLAGDRAADEFVGERLCDKMEARGMPARKQAGLQAVATCRAHVRGGPDGEPLPIPVD
jgi:hypothetical protein